MKRRTALQALTASMLYPALSSSASSSTKKCKTAIGLNGFESVARKNKKNFPIWEILDFASDVGFDGVELVDNWPMGRYPKSDEEKRIASLRRLYDQYGLQVFSIQNSAGDAFDPDAEKRKAWIALMRERLQLAKGLGCDCIGMWPGGGLRGQSMKQAIENLSSSFREVGKMASDLGIMAAFEIEPPFVFNTEKQLIAILEQVNHPSLKTIYDPSHFDLMNGSTGKPHEMLERIGVSNIGYVHFTDTDGTLRDGGTSKHLSCGDGHVDIPKSLATLLKGGFNGWIMIDEWEIPDPYDACIKGKQAIDKVF